MNKLFVTFLFILFPSIALAADGSSLSFAPPASDLSVVFLGNLFGSVDGVLHGSGSEIMGTMFSVFNSAVLALGGIIIMYTLMVSTMNTAHEGQVLGQKWSSIWIPVRSTAGLALLMPKASGYCLMQIFIMWIVLQGVGAADKIWDAALGYLNRGGVIIRAEPINPGGSGGEGLQIEQGAATMLSGQVCMLGIQKALEQQRQSYLKDKEKKLPACSGDQKILCDTPVPDFINSVNAISTQSQSRTASTFQAPMPNLPGGPYSFLNGICGKIQWNAMTEDQITKIKDIAGSLTQTQTITMSRAIGVQQMYMNLSTVARTMVNNDPVINPPAQEGTGDNFSRVADAQFGVPYKDAGVPCDTLSVCVAWGPAAGTDAPVLFNGTEFYGAISDYNAVLAPSMSLLSQSGDMESARATRHFIAKAEQEGWMMAGSYFFQLVILNSSAAASSSTTMDTTSGLDESNFDITSLTDPFAQGNQCTGRYAKLCEWLDKTPDLMNNLKGLINNANLQTAPVTLKTETPTVVTGIQSSTVYGFINNSLKMSTPGQPGIDPKFTFADHITVKPDMSGMVMPHQDFDCGQIKIGFFKFCLQRFLGDIFYNDIFRFMYNLFVDTIGVFIQQLIFAMIVIPLKGFGYMFKAGLEILSVPGINPVVALAIMGTAYINFSGNLWMTMVLMAAIPGVNLILMPVFAVGLPLVISWTGVMLVIGFVTAYYVPLLPYLMFTFGTIAWLMVVIEGMVAGPLIALGVTYPEGHDAFGKGEHAIMILMNVFLRPSMMIIGYISAIALSYVGVWVLNQGFQNAVSFMQPPSAVEAKEGPGQSGGWSNDWGKAGQAIAKGAKDATDHPGATAAAAAPGVALAAAAATPEGRAREKAAAGATWNWLKHEATENKTFKPPSAKSVSGGYNNWAGLFAMFFAVLAYTSAYLTIVQKAFSLINALPDKVLRWIGGQPEGAGAEAEKMGDEVKGKIGEGGKDTITAQTQIGKHLQGKAMAAKDTLSGGGGGKGGVQSAGDPGPSGGGG